MALRWHPSLLATRWVFPLRWAVAAVAGEATQELRGRLVPAVAAQAATSGMDQQEPQTQVAAVAAVAALLDLWAAQAAPAS
jgi:hypothetical protein